MSNNKGTLISAPIRPFSDLDTYPSFYANEGLGGCHNVSSLQERDSIPLDRLKDGMLCTVGGNIYQYLNQVWVGLTIGTIDPLAVHKYVGLIGDGVTDTFIVQHDLGTEDVLLDVRYVVSKERAEVYDAILDVNNISLVFSQPPLANEFRVIVIG
jgi:hypothetical protein